MCESRILRHIDDLTSNIRKKLMFEYISNVVKKFIFIRSFVKIRI